MKKTVLLNTLEERGYTDLSAVDIDDYLYHRKFESHLKKADLYKDTIPFNDQSADCIFAFNMLEHLV